ncbi:MAG: TonB-dependent receptor [Bacteroidetes bacterium]|nr:TonB-dependent receptor [Bacteroidota bacterium]
MKTLLTIIALFFCLNSYAQYKVTGTVSDAITNEKLIHAKVYIADLKKTISTDSSGVFSISDLPGTFVQLQFSLQGYRSYTLTIETDKITAPLQITLLPNEFTTEDIIVNETNPDKPYQADKINSRDLQRMGSMNISEAVARIPGVWELSTGTGVSKPVIRGLYGNRIGIMINGIRFDNQQWQDEHGLVLSSDGIDNIEVIKGPRSLLYGPEAIGGVVSITDEHPAAVGTNLADLNLKYFSNTIGILADIGLKGAEEKFNWLVRFGGETHGDYIDGSGDRMPSTRFGGYTMKTSLGTNKGIWVGNLNYAYTNYTYGILEQRDFQKEFRNTKETRFDRSFNGAHHQLKVHNMVLQNTFNADRSKFKVNLGYTYNQRVEREGNDERFLPDSLQFGNLDMVLNTASLDASWNYTFKKDFDITVGTQEFIQSNKNNGQRRLIPDADVSSGSLTSILKYQKNKFGFEAGGRFDLFKVKTTEYGVLDSANYFPPLDLNYNSVNGSAGATYRFNKNFLVKANLSTGFRAPNLAELTSNGLHEGTFQYEIGNKDFKNEQSVEGDIGFVIDSKYVSLDFSAYNNSINNYIYLGLTTDTYRGYPVYRYYQEDATLKGFEADLVVNPADWLSLRGTYSTVIAKRSDGVNLPLIPSDKFSASAHIELKNWKFFYNPYFELSANTALEKTRLGENETSLPGYTLLNLGFGCDLSFEKELFNMTIACNNLLDKTYIDFMSRIKTLTAVYDGQTFYANNIGRNIVFTIKVPFQLSY